MTLVRGANLFRVAFRPLLLTLPSPPPSGGSRTLPVAGAIAMILPLSAVPVVSLLTQPPQAVWIDKAFGTSQTQADQS
jgi:hypothetical protein